MAGQTQEMTDSSKPKGLAARILGEQPTGLQKTFFWLMILSLTLWPLLFFVSLFFFDAPIRTTVAMIMLTLFHLLSTRTDIIRGCPIRVSKNFVKANVELTAND